MGLFDFIGDLFSSDTDYRANAPGLADQDRQRRFAAAIQTAQNRPNVQMNMAPQDQFRQGQTGLVGQLQQQAAGQGPSLGTQMLQQGNEQNIQAANALAASARGNMNPALLQRNVMNTAAQGGQNVAQQAATMRIQEQQAAQNQLAQALQSARGQDIGAAQANAQLSLQSQQLRDELVAKYESLGLSADQAQLAAAMESQRINAGIETSNAQGANQITGSLLGGASRIGAAMATGGA